MHGSKQIKGADGKTVTVEVFDSTEDHIKVSACPVTTLTSM
jgi:hypothetical protein